RGDKKGKRKKAKMRKKRKRKRAKKPEGLPASETPQATEPAKETMPPPPQPAAGKTEGQDWQPREAFLQGRFARAVLAAIRNHKEGIPEAKLDYLFGLKAQAPEREKVFAQLKFLNLAECYPTGHGGRLWVAKYASRRREEKVEVKANVEVK